MNKLFKLAFLAFFSATVACSLTSCESNDDSPQLDGNGITAPSMTDTYSAYMEGEEFTLSFTAEDSWTASASESWIKLQPASGSKGESQIKVTVSPNTNGANRVGSISVKVKNYIFAYELKVRQGEADLSTFTEFNKFIYNYMAERYLWNEPIPNLKLNGSASYSKFFESILTGIDALDHMNRDDGHWEKGKRESYYSYIERSSASKSRAFGYTETGSGIYDCTAKFITSDQSVAALVPLGVAPDSPADKAGLKRGSLVTKVNGSAVTQYNVQTLYEKLMTGNCSFETVKYIFDDNGYATGLTDPETGYVEMSTYTDPAIYTAKVMTDKDNGTKIGYLCYMYFDLDYDDQLIETFNLFKQNGVSELVLDLRYNGGGHVVSSTLLATLIAGENHKDKVYDDLVYNARRVAKGEKATYKIGNSATPDGQYTKISTALSSSLGLNRVYVLTTVYTASASELIINGLRGLDIDVRVIGTTTNGKNVGMESDRKIIGTYEYIITPITFYSKNAKGFGDYADGFQPDVELDEERQIIGDWGTTDDALFYLAFYWMHTGNRPNLSVSRSALPYGSNITLSNDHKRTKREGAIVMPGYFEN